MKKLFYLIIFVFTLQSCGDSNESYDEEITIEESVEGYEDGTYCAEVEYYNPNTGTNKTYKLDVEVYNNEVTQINWGNGGWMDEDHFSAGELDSDGTCSFTSDKGYDYTITILGTDCGGTDESSFQNDVEEDEQDLVCPNCGGDKEDYDDYCYSCQQDEY